VTREQAAKATRPPEKPYRWVLELSLRMLDVSIGCMLDVSVPERMLDVSISDRMPDVSVPERMRVVSISDRMPDVSVPCRAAVLSTPGLIVSPFEVTGCPWSGRVFSTPLPRVDCPLESVTPDWVWSLVVSVRDAAVESRAAPT
jgi:hypothetical protein